MDDPRTTEALKELAGLYLTGLAEDSSSTPPNNPPQPDAQPAPSPQHDGHDVHLHLAGGAEPVHGPQSPAATTTAGVELVLTGHLPASAGLWLNQAAAQLDRGSFYEQINGLVADPPLWLIHVHERPDAGLGEIIIDHVRRWTVLTGADDAAIVACYRKFYMDRLKRLEHDKDEFRRKYMLTSMRLMMHSSFLKKKLGSLGRIPAEVDRILRRFDREGRDEQAGTA